MKGRPVESFQAVSKRLLVYSVIFLILTWLTHFYVTNPLYVQKMPYFAKAMWAGFDVECDLNTPLPVSNLLKKVSLPYFSLKGEVTYLNREGETFSCQTQGASSNVKSIFRFASMTKAVTSAAMIELAREGQVDLDAKVLSFFSEVDPQKVKDPNVREIRLNHLLNHSSGLGGPFGSDNMVASNERPWCPYDIQTLETVRLAGKPGSKHLYSNVAYCLLGEVISKVAGVEFQQYINETYLSDYETLRFVEGAYLPKEPVYDFSNEYRFTKDYVEWLDFYALSSSAGLIGYPEEFAMLVRDLVARNPQILKGDSAENCEERSLERCYSYNFVKKKGQNGQMVGVQQGYLPGASSLVAVTPDGQVLVWVAAGAALESKHKDLMVDRVVAFLTSQ